MCAGWLDWSARDFDLLSGLFPSIHSTRITACKLGADESQAGQERAFGKVGLKKAKAKARGKK